MQRAGKTVLTALRRAAGSEKPLDLLAAVWPLVAGVRLAEQTRPISWEKGWLKISVWDTEWQQQLERMPHTLRDRINRWWGARVVEEISYVRGKKPREEGPRISPRKGKRAERPPAPPVDIAELKESLERIRDPEIRKLVAKVAQRYLSK
jgi:predicted nucleic acid-binding Zn ribbon protein